MSSAILAYCYGVYGDKKEGMEYMWRCDSYGCVYMYGKRAARALCMMTDDDVRQSGQAGIAAPGNQAR